METRSFSDGLGRRVPAEGEAGERLESLKLCSEIAETPLARAAVIEGVTRLGGFRHPAFATVRCVECPGGVAGGLGVIAEAADGVRLSDLLLRAERLGIEVEPDATLHLLRRTVSAIAALHAHARQAAHGAIGPERVMVTPEGSVVVADYVLGSALEQLQWARSRFWTVFRVPVPSVAGTVRFDQQTDVVQLGVLAVALLRGRLLLRDEFPQGPAQLLDEAPADLPGRPRSVPAPIRAWVARALQVDSRLAFRTAVEAESALEAALAAAPTCRPSAAAVQNLLSRCREGEHREAGPFRQRTEWLPGASVSIPPRPAAELFPARTEEAGPRAVAAEAPRPRTNPSGRRSEARRRGLRRMARVGVLGIGLGLLLSGSFLGARSYLGSGQEASAVGTLVVESRPTGLEVLVDGEPAGRTPATFQLPAGPHTLVVRSARGATRVPVTVVGGDRRVARVDVRRPRTARSR